MRRLRLNKPSVISCVLILVLVILSLGFAVSSGKMAIGEKLGRVWNKQLPVRSIGIENTAKNNDEVVEAWNMQASEAIILLQSIKHPPQSPVIRALLNRLIVSKASLKGNDKEQMQWLEERLRLLMLLGKPNQVLQMFATLPVELRSDNVMKMMVEARFLTTPAPHHEACKDVTTAMKSGAMSRFWQELTMYCEAIRGNRDHVAFMLRLLEEDKMPIPYYRQRLLEQIISKYEVFTTELLSSIPEEPELIDVLLCEASGVALPERTALRDLPLAFIPYIGNTKTNSISVRIQALELALRYGLISGETLTKQYSRLVFSKDDFQDAASDIVVMPPWEKRALLYQLAVLGQYYATGKRLFSLLQALQQFYDDGLGMLVEPVFSPLLPSITIFNDKAVELDPSLALLIPEILKIRTIQYHDDQSRNAMLPWQRLAESRFLASAEKPGLIVLNFIDTMLQSDTEDVSLQEWWGTHAEKLQRVKPELSANVWWMSEALEGKHYEEEAPFTLAGILQSNSDDFVVLTVPQEMILKDLSHQLLSKNVSKVRMILMLCLLHETYSVDSIPLTIRLMTISILHHAGFNAEAKNFVKEQILYGKGSDIWSMP